MCFFPAELKQFYDPRHYIKKLFKPPSFSWHIQPSTNLVALTHESAVILLFTSSKIGPRVRRNPPATAPATAPTGWTTPWEIRALDPGGLVHLRVSWQRRCQYQKLGDIIQKGTLWRPHFYGVLKKSRWKSIFGQYIIKCVHCFNMF